MRGTVKMHLKIGENYHRMRGDLLQCFLQQSATIMPRKMKREMTIPLRTGAQQSRKAGQDREVQWRDREN